MEEQHRQKAIRDKALNMAARMSNPKLVAAFDEWHACQGAEAIARRAQRAQQGAVCRALAECLGSKR